MKKVIKTYVCQLSPKTQDDIRRQLESYGLTKQEVQDAMDSKISDITGNPETPISIPEVGIMAADDLVNIPQWIPWTDDYKDYATCSECEFGAEGELLAKDTTPYCPWCGAHMPRYGLDILR